MSLNAMVVNVYPSTPSEQFTNWPYKLDYHA